MKKLFLLLGLIIFSLQADAALPVNEQNLEAAIAYGKSYQGEKNNVAMLQPWMIAESLATNPYRDEERLVIYTPYLLTALDTVEKTSDDTTVSFALAQELVKRYEGVLVVRAIINAPVILEAKEVEVQLLQNSKIISPYHIDYLDGQYIDKKVTASLADKDLQGQSDRTETIQKKAALLQEQLEELQNNKVKPSELDLEQQKRSKLEEVTDEVKQKICRLQYNFYFDQSEFDVNMPYLLVIKDAYCGSREFAVDPALLK